MSGKVIVVYIAIVATLGMFLFKENLQLSFGFTLSVTICSLCVFAWVTNIKKRRDEKPEALKKSSKNDKKNRTEVDPEDDEEYHNDFSKVPAGVADPNQPLPRSIGYGYGVGSQTVEEDLARIGIKDKKDE